MKLLNHKIEFGESLEEICKFYKISKETFFAYNNTRTAQSGIVVIIPQKIKTVVEPNDDLSSLSKKLLCTEKELSEKFGDKFFIGEILEL